MWFSKRLHNTNACKLPEFPDLSLGLQWFAAAGFQDIKIKRIGPKWYRGVRRHGLIMGCSVTGIKPKVCRIEETASRSQ